jgi:hypothetical protein
VLKDNAAHEAATRSRVQRDLPLKLLPIVFVSVLVLAPLLSSTSRVGLAALCGGGLGWLLAGYAIGAWASRGKPRDEREAPERTSGAEIVVPLLLFLASPLTVFMAAPEGRPFIGEALSSIFTPPFFVTLAAGAMRLKRRGVLLAFALPVLGVLCASLAVASWSAHVSANARDNRLAVTLCAGVLPVLFAGFWWMRSVGGSAVLGVISGVLASGAVWANARLVGVFFHAQSYRFTSFAALAFTLALSSFFFALELAPGRLKTLCLRASLALLGSTTLVTGLLFFTRIVGPA